MICGSIAHGSVAESQRKMSFSLETIVEGFFSRFSDIQNKRECGHRSHF
jgi:hypothetical protein